jgi:hypothetical protein
MGGAGHRWHERGKRIKDERKWKNGIKRDGNKTHFTKTTSIDYSAPHTNKPVTQYFRFTRNLRLPL